MFEVINWVGQNHKTKIKWFLELQYIKAFDLIDAVADDKTIYYQIIITYEWNQWWFFYEMSKNARDVLVSHILDYTENWYSFDEKGKAITLQSKLTKWEI